MDLNADVGESFGRWTLGDDDTLLTVVTSANVACGFHAGDPPTVRRSCVTAAVHGVAIGAQVAYRDLAGFGRRFVDMEPGDLRDDVLYQLGALEAFARSAGGRVTYVKPHGALYHATRDDAGQAQAVVEAAAEFDPSLAVLGLPGSQLLAAAADAGLRGVTEAFADRRYTADGGLVPRSRPDAVITDPDAVAEQVTRMVTAGEVVADDGTVVPLRPESICVHGDSPGAVDLARRVRRALVDAGFPPTRFA
ncbi:LamB/YcsF family protein [Spongisporangium articulatum]|uniref:5-oxoprolinase subunit A n=1 Tax=Spongisporangium articulatum TaxID=3362603 RepID=A0ABW8AJ16_9ACTN